jgi:hypothetical protein
MYVAYISRRHRLLTSYVHTYRSPSLVEIALPTPTSMYFLDPPNPPCFKHDVANNWRSDELSRGINYIRSSLNWGPTVQLNRAFKTFALWFDRRGSFGNEFHTFTMEWTPEFLYVSIICPAYIPLSIILYLLASYSLPNELHENAEAKSWA